MSFSRDDSSPLLIHPRPEHFLGIQELCRKVYPFSKPWAIAQLESHLYYFPDGQLIVIDQKNGKVLGMAFSLIVSWDDYSPQDNWRDFTSGGYFHNHNPKGTTLYGAEVMVDPEYRGQGIGRMLYQGRQQIVEKYGLKRVRAGARLRGYGKFRDKLSAQEYVKQVVEKKIYDPTLSFQLNQGFVAIDVAKNYIMDDPESLGYAAVIEWLNPKLASPQDLRRQKERVEQLILGERFISEFLPKELRRLVRKSTLTLGGAIREAEGETFYRKIEYYRENLKKARFTRNQALLARLLQKLGKESRQDRLKIAHAFALQLETVNTCEAAYRTWRQRQKVPPVNLKEKTELSFVLTAHPTEGRTSPFIGLLEQIEGLLIEGIHHGCPVRSSA